MKKIMMTNYGFIRWPEEDFTDDGSKFYCYRVGERVRVSKCTYKGEAYISARIEGNKLPYTVYSKLPHYTALDKLNGVSIDSLTDQDLFDLCEACLMYEKEYTDAEANLNMPTLEEIKEQCAKVQAKRAAEFAEVEAMLGKYAAKLAMYLPDWQWKTIQEYLTTLAAKRATFSPELYAPTLVDTARSVIFCGPNCSELGNSYYYNHLMDIIKSVQD
jgi:hypothetical protein